MAEDYYKTLEVGREASQAEIQKAYRRLAREYHPDLHPDDKDAKSKFQEVQKAFDILNDPQKRELYDRYGSSFENMQGGGGPGARPGGAAGEAGGYSAGFDSADFREFFGERYGGGDAGGGFADIFSQFTRAAGSGGRRGSGRRAAPKGEDVRFEQEIPFQTAITGGETTLAVRREGELEQLSVKIPAGIEDGKTIRLRGQGEPSPYGGAAGDMLLKVRIASHPFFQRRGPNLYVRLPVTLKEAMAGTKVDVPTPYGTVALRVPPGSSGGAKLRIKGYGVRKPGGVDGDLFAELQIVLPKDPSEEDLAWIEGFDARHPLNPRPDLRW